MDEYQDYASTSIQAEQTEIKTLMYELGRCLHVRGDSNNETSAKIQTLDTRAPEGADSVKNEGLELIPRLPYHCYLPVKDRVAPLKLKFEFFDSQTREKLKNPTCVVYHSLTEQFPSAENSWKQKTDFKNPYLIKFCKRELQGKTIPEYDPKTKERIPPQVYLSIESLNGCLCTVTVSFPLEKKYLQNKQQRQPIQRTKTMLCQLTKQQEYF